MPPPDRILCNLRSNTSYNKAPNPSCNGNARRWDDALSDCPASSPTVSRGMCTHALSVFSACPVTDRQDTAKRDQPGRDWTALLWPRRIEGPRPGPSISCLCASLGRLPIFCLAWVFLPSSTTPCARSAPCHFVQLCMDRKAGCGIWRCAGMHGSFGTLLSCRRRWRAQESQTTAVRYLSAITSIVYRIHPSIPAVVCL